MSGHKIHYPYPAIGSLSTLAKTLDITEQHLSRLAQNPGNFYNVFKKKVGTKERDLCDPRPELKIVQKKINTRILQQVSYPPYLHGGIKSEGGKDFLSNATAHSHAEVVVALDIRSYFPSITFDHVLRVFRYLFKFPDDVSNTLAKLVTLNNSVPQGAPPSSYISNLVMWEREYRLVAKFESMGLSYSRLIDDITVSSKTRLPAKTISRVASDVIGMLKFYGFEQNADKFQVYDRADPHKLMQVTGLWLNRGQPRVLRSKRQDISNRAAVLYKIASNNVVHRTTPDFHEDFAAVSGQVALLKRLKHSESSRLRSMLAAVPPIFDGARASKLKKLVSMFCNKAMDRSKAGYIRRFYQLQHEVAILKRTDAALAKKLQARLNKRIPTKRLKDIYE